MKAYLVSLGKNGEVTEVFNHEVGENYDFERGPYSPENENEIHFAVGSNQLVVDPEDDTSYPFQEIKDFLAAEVIPEGFGPYPVKN